jgi:hypothetical protein
MELDCNLLESNAYSVGRTLHSTRSLIHPLNATVITGTKQKGRIKPRIYVVRFEVIKAVSMMSAFSEHDAIQTGRYVQMFQFKSMMAALPSETSEDIDQTRCHTPQNSNIYYIFYWLKCILHNKYKAVLFPAGNSTDGSHICGLFCNILMKTRHAQKAFRS